MDIYFEEKFMQLMEEKNLDTVVLMGHINPDGDAVGSVMGLAHYIKVNYPQYKVFPYLGKNMDKGAAKMVQKDRVFAPFKMSELSEGRYGVIVCDTATLKRLVGLEFYENAAASMVIDHHVSNEGFGDINITKKAVACAENIYYLLDQDRLQKAAREECPTAADYIYMGILHDTGCFTRNGISTMEAMTGLLKLGVKHEYVMETMHNDTLEILEKRARLLQRVECVLDGKVAYICMNRQESMEENISYADLHSMSPILCACEDIGLAFIMYEEETRWHCSFRSKPGWLDVNKLLEPFGGGGHAEAAGLRVKVKDITEMREKILERVQEIANNIAFN